MGDRCAQTASVSLGGCPEPLRGGRPQHRAPKRHDRVHPYRKSAAGLLTPARLVTCAESMNGASNGHTSTLSKGVNGVKHENGGANRPSVQELIGKVASGSLDPQLAAERVQELPGAYKADEPINNANWGDNISQKEIVWAPGKNPAQVAIALQRASQEGKAAMAARVSPAVADEVTALLPNAKFSAVAGALSVPPSGNAKQERLPGTIAIVSDVAGEDSILEETRLASAALGCYAYRLGGGTSGAGLSGLLPNLQAVQSAAVVIVIAREEIALPAVIAGLVQSPVIAVPSSSDGVVAASSPGVSVVDSNNGIAAAMTAARILTAAARLRSPA